MEYMIPVERGVRVYVNDMNPAGRNPILFMHGWPADHTCFDYQYNELLSKGYRCIAWDARGFGNSDKPTYGYDYNRTADDLRAVIDALGLRNVTLLGHSTAGAVALRYVARHNAHGVGKLVLAAAAAPSLIQRPGFPFGLTEQDVLAIIAQTEVNRPQMVWDFCKMFFYTPQTEADMIWFLNMCMRAAIWSTIQVSYAWLRETLFADMAAVKIPTLILHGVHDQVCKFQLGVALNQGIAGSRLVPFQDSGHGLFIDQMDLFNAELMKFLG